MMIPDYFNSYSPCSVALSLDIPSSDQSYTKAFLTVNKKNDFSVPVLHIEYTLINFIYISLASMCQYSVTYMISISRPNAHIRGQDCGFV